MNGFPVGMLWSVVHICMVLWTPEAPMAVVFVANMTPQLFSIDKHPQGHPDLPEQPQAQLLLL